MSSADVLLEVEDLRHAYGERDVLRGVSISLPRRAIGCLLGPSGCGKTTVLRCIAGFEPVRHGSVRIAGRLVSAPSVQVPPEQRHVGVVFQDHALFPHLSVARNIGFGLRRAPRAERARRVQELAELVGLPGELARYPHQLSGGQQQRVALARALAPRPDLLLLDEPFSSLDVELRERLSIELREIIRASETTAILVTHDQHEAFAMADRIGVMHGGRIEQWDSAHALYHRPATRFIAGFVGEGAFLPAAMIDGRRVRTELGVLEGELRLAPAVHAPEGGGESLAVELLLRPADVVPDAAAPVRAQVAARAFRGPDILYTLRLGSGRSLLSLVPSHCDHALGEEIGVRVEPEHLVVFEARSGVA